jgi:hypothetical protein
MCTVCNDFIKKGYKFCPMCGEKLELEIKENIWTYLEALDKPDTYEQWRLAHKLLMMYANKGANIEAKEFLEFVKKEIAKEFNSK